MKTALTDLSLEVKNSSLEVVDLSLEVKNSSLKLINSSLERGKTPFARPHINEKEQFYVA